jgi:hypothetical protein
MLALHTTVAVPDPVMLVGVIAPHVNPEGTVSVSVTTPANLLTAVTVIVDVPEVPALPVTELATIAKSRYWKRMVALWTSGPLVAVAVRV